MGLPVSKCPYCDGDHFTNNVIRADSPALPEDITDVEGVLVAAKEFDEVYGFWFNECASCKGWSVYKNGKNLKMKSKSKTPKKHSLGKFKKD